MIEKAQRHKLLRFFYAERRGLLRSVSAAFTLCYLFPHFVENVELEM